MWTRIRNVWHPENFHYHHQLRRGRGSFEGWYFKLVDAEERQPVAIIPGVFLGEGRHAFVQVLDGRAGTAAYHRFPLDEFEADRRAFRVRIARNHFGADGISLDIASGETDAGQRVKGELRCGPFRSWPSSLFSPGVMGPYGFVPFMECNHGILSLDHTIDGRLVVDDIETDFDGGRGYVEKDWGRAFPSGYVWTQSNHFDRPGISLTASVARTPWLTRSFRGVLVGFLVDGTLHRFMTYEGAEIEALRMSETHLHLRIRNRAHRLEVDARTAQGAILHAPYERQMIERVAETMTSEVAVRLTSIARDELVYEGVGRHACLEAQGDLAAVLDA